MPRTSPRMHGQLRATWVDSRIMSLQSRDPRFVSPKGAAQSSPGQRPGIHFCGLFASGCMLTSQRYSTTPTLRFKGLEARAIMFTSFFVCRRILPWPKWWKRLRPVPRSGSRRKNPLFGRFTGRAAMAGFSVSPADVEAVTEYIDRQEVHHRVVGFQEEFRKFLETYNVEYDERYVWD